MAMGSKFLGYNKKEVERYLDQLRSLHEADYKKLDAELRSLKQENDATQKEIEELNTKSQQTQTLEVLEFSLQRIETVYGYLKKYQEEDYREIFRNEYLIKENLKEKIAKIEQEIQGTKENIKKELEQINKLIKPTNLSLVGGGKDVPEKKKEEPNVRMMNNTITADGTSLFDEIEDKKNDSVRSNNTQSEEKKASIFQMTSFWGKTDAVAEENKIEKEETKIVPPKQSIEKEAEKKSEWNELHDLDLLSISEMAASREEAIEHPAQQEDKRASVSVDKETMRTNIDLTRYKYILGKIAGEDLMDNAGGIIIHKHEMITAEIIEQAQRENKLSDLIIHMLIQGMEE